jgi:AcrR family transcriptional regulator
VAGERRNELLELAYGYVRENGVAGLSLRPLAAAVGSSPRVLLFLFGSKDGLVRALLARAREEELELLARIRREQDGLTAAGEALWGWLSDERHHPLLRLWVEAYAQSLVDRDGPWSGFAAATVSDWLDVLAAADDDSPGAPARRTAVLAVLRGATLDLLATGDTARTTAAVRQALSRLRPAPAGTESLLRWQP